MGGSSYYEKGDVGAWRHGTNTQYPFKGNCGRERNFGTPGKRKGEGDEGEFVILLPFFLLFR